MSRILIAALLLMGAVIASAQSEHCWTIPDACITPGGNGGLPCPEILHFQEGTAAPAGANQNPLGVNSMCVAPGVTSTLPTCALAAAPQASPAICVGSECCHPSKGQLIPRCPFSLHRSYFTTTGTKKVCVRTVPASTTPCDVDSGFCPCEWTGIKCSGLANPASQNSCASNIYMYMVDGNGAKRALLITTAGTPQIAHPVTGASPPCANNLGFCAPSVASGGVASIDSTSNPVTIKVHTSNTNNLIWQCQLGVLGAGIGERAYLGCRVVV